MELNFDKTFGKKSFEELDVPSAVINHLNSKIPEGTKYYSAEDGTLIIGPEKEMSVKGLKAVLTEEDKGILGETFTNDDIISLYYNKQEPLYLEPIDEGYLEVNNEKVATEDFIKNYKFPNLKLKKTVLFPKPFTEKPFYLHIKADGIYEELQFKRVPVASVKSRRFESLDLNFLTIALEFELNNKINLHFKFSPEKEGMAKDYYLSILTFNALCSYQFEFDELILDFEKDNTHVNQMIDAGSIMFWRKVCELETKLGCHFKVPLEGVSKDDFLIIEELYQNIVNGIPTIALTNVTSINFSNEEKDKDELEKYKYKRLDFSFISETVFNLLGERLDLPYVACSYNSMVLNIESEKNNNKIVFGDSSQVEKIYNVVLYFKSKNECNDYMEINDNKTILENFKEAKSIKYYLETANN